MLGQEIPANHVLACLSHNTHMSVVFGVPGNGYPGIKFNLFLSLLHFKCVTCGTAHVSKHFRLCKMFITAQKPVAWQRCRITSPQSYCKLLWARQSQKSPVLHQKKEPLAPRMGLSAKLASSWALSKLCPPSTTLLITAKRKQQSSVQRQFLPSLFLWGLLPLQMCAQVSLVSLISVNNYC